MSHLLPVVDVAKRIAYLEQNTTLYAGETNRRGKLEAFIHLEKQKFRELKTYEQRQSWMLDGHLVRYRLREEDTIDETFHKARIDARRRQLNAAEVCTITHHDPNRDDSSDDDAAAAQTDCHSKKEAAHERSRLYYIYGEEGLDTDDPADWIIASVYYSVKSTTFTGYLSAWRAFTAAGLEINYDNLPQLFCLDHQTKKVKASGSYGQMLAAVRLYLVAHNKAPEYVLLRAKASSEGLKRLNAASSQRPPRGGIDNDMMRAMLELPDADIPREYKDNFILLQATGLRGNQLAQTELSRIELDVEDSSLVVCPANHKGRGSQAKRQGWEIHTTRREWAVEVKRIVESRRLRGDVLLAPGWNPTLANRYIAFAAKKLGWSKTLVWVVHSLRHGAAMTSFANTKGGIVEKLLSTKSQTAHRSNTMLLAYSQSNEEREIISSGDKKLRAQMRNLGLNEGAIAATKDRVGRGAAAEFQDRVDEESIKHKKIVAQMLRK